MLKSENWFFRYEFNLVYSDWERTDIVPIYDALVFSGTFWVSLGQLLTSDVDCQGPLAILWNRRYVQVPPLYPGPCNNVIFLSNLLCHSSNNHDKVPGPDFLPLVNLQSLLLILENRTMILGMRPGKIA